MSLALWTLAAWLTADFITGAFHWFEDRYLSEDMPGIRGTIAHHNNVHHVKPTEMTTYTVWQNLAQPALVCWPLALLATFAGLHFAALTLFFTAFGNVVHRFAHIPKRKLPAPVRLFQRAGIFISHEHHDSHHRFQKRLNGKENARIAYCPMTNYVNPVLDYLYFWDFAESALQIIGLKPLDRTAKH